MDYIGRFAPSPTGPLHMGSLVTAVASYCQAKSKQGKWLLRIEDLDPPREIEGASNDIIMTLEACGFEWDGEIIYQSQRSNYYEQVLDQLKELELSYPCGCSRADITASGQQTSLGVRYPGTCREGLPKGKSPRSIRMKTSTEKITFVDKMQGEINLDPEQDTGDFVIKRADGEYAYQLAVVVDDALQNITEIVRGSDLLNLTTRQIYLQRALNYTTPSYAHVPVLVNQLGDKLSKQNLAKAIDKSNLPASLYQALCYLNQAPPKDLIHAEINEIWEWATMNWQITNVIKQLSIPQ